MIISKLDFLNKTSDHFQSSSMGRRRHPWVISSQICAFLASLGLLFVGDPPTQFIKTLVISFFIHSIFASIQDASVDAQAIITIPLNERRRINGFMHARFLVGSAMDAAGLSAILRTYDYLTCALMTSILLFVRNIVEIHLK
jgi:PAT family beta-lactamase induction signal transducer AmpG